VTPVVVVAIVLGAVVGAPLRYAVERRLAGSWPWGTFAVNVAGSLVMGALVGVLTARDDLSSSSTLLALVGTGFCGSLTTFGGYAAQVLDLAVAPRDGSAGARSGRALVYATGSILVCVGVAAGAYAVSSWVTA
jgi:CrcB protein